MSLVRRLRRPFSTAAAVLNPSDPSAVLTAKQKSRLALSLLKSERSPDRILSICRAAALSPLSHLDRTALSLAVSNLSPSSPQSVRSLLSDLLLKSPNPSSPNPHPKSLSHAIVLFGQAGLLSDAESAFKSSPPTPQSLNSLLFAAILAKNHDAVPRIFREFPANYGVIPNLNTYNIVIKSFCESGSSRSFYSMLDEMGRKGINPNLTTFCHAIEGFYKEEKFDDVTKVLKSMRSHACHAGGLSVYNVRIQSLCKLKRSGEAKALLEEMVSNRVKPNWVTYSHLVVGFCKEGNLEEAKRVYKEMGRRGCVAESSCYFSLIHYLCKGGDFEAALGVCKETMERNWVPCFATMKMLVNGLVNGSKVEEAREIVGKMKERFPNNAEMWKEVEEGLPQ